MMSHLYSANHELCGSLGPAGLVLDPDWHDCRGGIPSSRVRLAETLLTFGDDPREPRVCPMHIDWWSIQIPIPVALAFVAAMGYLISRWHRPAANDMRASLAARIEARASRGGGIGANHVDGQPESGEAPRQRVEVQGASRPPERSTAGGRLERSVPGGRRHSQAHAATGNADRQRLRRNSPAKRNSDDASPRCEPIR